ncbi:ricin-type beta-trefoil lectin domain protein [Actinocrinis sp.]|uniref:ricin-type beta-trefoil lectin domain protein n=1 Tax=Actinocrinis sp. TaxID=1920516 RepID=UPI0039C86092
MIGRRRRLAAGHVGGACLDVTGQNTAPGMKIESWSCNAGENQRWMRSANGEPVSAQSGLCLDDPSPLLLATSWRSGPGTVARTRGGPCPSHRSRP